MIEISYSFKCPECGNSEITSEFEVMSQDEENITIVCPTCGEEFTLTATLFQNS